MSQYRLGRLDAVRPDSLGTLEDYASGPLPLPAATVTVPNVPYPIDFNDQLGDCVMAGVAHLIAAWDAEVHESDPIPNANTVEAEYFKLTGGQDTGLNEQSVLQTWHTQGLFRRKIAGYAPVEPTDTLSLHRAIEFYGGAMLGIQCPASAQQQFAAGEPWTYVPGSPIEGGHCIVALGYDPQYIYCATWGGIAPVTYTFAAHFLDEAWAVLPKQIVEARKDAYGIDLVSLQRDLAAL
jgi:hypothetical protein